MNRKYTLFQILNQIEETINKKEFLVAKYPARSLLAPFAPQEHGHEKGIESVGAEIPCPFPACPEGARKGQSNTLLSISGGQDSIFLLFCLSFLQRQIGFNLRLIWCNHFWQKDSFYTTLHLTKSAHAFSLPIIGFVPLHVHSPFSVFQLRFLRKRKFLIPKKCKSARSLYENFNCSFRAPTRPSPSCGAVPLRGKEEQAGARQAGNGQGILPPSLLVVQTVLKNTQSVLPLKKRKIRVLHRRCGGRVFRHQGCACNRSLYNSQPCTFSCVAPSFAIKDVCTIFKKEKRFTAVLSEATARNWRHITVERSCAFYNSNRCVHGHTLSDRVETILFNLIRGAGSKGAASLVGKRQHSSFCYNKFYPCLEQFKKTTHINNC